MDKYDLIVVGAGHAGCEAAMALAKLGRQVLLLTSNVDRIGHLSCNPAIGGLAKGHLVREIDALGGVMGLWADAAGIQFRVLNRSKGPAVRARRAQIDRAEYLRVARREIFGQPNLTLRQDMVDEVLAENGNAAGVRTALGKDFFAKAVLLTTGTFLRGLIHIGLNSRPGGRLGDAAAIHLSESLKKHGLELGRLKTGTTPRLLGRSIDFSKLEIQDGEKPAPGFSFHGPGPHLPQRPCHITWTTPATHEIIRSGLKRSPLFTGVITGTGARYCPSIEDKVARFPERERHQLFIEPEGLDCNEYYANGISTSLPFDVQESLVHSVPGLERAEIVRPGYAIEYDYADPIQLQPTLETKVLPGLWLAGQINGTSGYEEAAAQGLWAALNIEAQFSGKPPFLPGRDQAYLAVLVDELVTKGTREPFRMFTSRAEYRLLLREDNADARLTPLGREYGLVGDAQWRKFSDKQTRLSGLLEHLAGFRLNPDTANRNKLAALGQVCPSQTISLAELARRPALPLEDLKVFLPELDAMEPDIIREADTILKYSGYLRRQEELVQRSAKLEETVLPESMDYTDLPGLSREVQEKLNKVKPRNLGQAGRISGVTPAALACVEIHLKKQELLERSIFASTERV